MGCPQLPKTLSILRILYDQADVSTKLQPSGASRLRLWHNKQRVISKHVTSGPNNVLLESYDLI